MVKVKPSIVAQGNDYKCIVSRDKVKFLDLIKYAPAKTSLAALIKSHKVEETKGFFPYKILSEPNLQARQLDFLTRDTYELFDDKLSKQGHRVQGNLLEGDWATYTRIHHVHSLQPDILLAVDDALEDKFPPSAETKLRWAQMKRDGLDAECHKERKDLNAVRKIEHAEEFNFILSLSHFWDVELQTQKSVDLETYGLLKFNESFSGASKTSNSHFSIMRTRNDSDHTKLPDLPTTGVCNLYQLMCTCKKLGMTNYKDLLQWYNNKDVEVMHPVIDDIN